MKGKEIVFILLMVKVYVGVDVQNYTHRISPEQVDYARSVLKGKSYSMTYKRDKYDRPFVELTVSSITPEEAKQMFSQENIANVVDEKISELHQREFNNTKNDIYSMKKNKWTVSNIVKDLRNKAEGSKSCAEFINKYDEMIILQNGIMLHLKTCINKDIIKILNLIVQFSMKLKCLSN